jgi:hypothetical protein
MVRNLTGYELIPLPQCYNLTGGHTFRRWFAAGEAIIDRSAQLFKKNNRQRQNKIEREYSWDILRLAKQSWDEDALGYLMCFRASVAFAGEGLLFPQ